TAVYALPLHDALPILCIICIGDPATPGGYLVKPVGEALAEYHPNVFGTLDRPVHEGNWLERWAEHGETWRSCFQIVIAPRGGDDNDIGFLVPSRARSEERRVGREGRARGYECNPNKYGNRL